MCRPSHRDRFCLYLWELCMPYPKYILHFAKQKTDNVTAENMLHLMSIRVVGVALGLVLGHGNNNLLPPSPLTSRASSVASVKLLREIHVNNPCNRKDLLLAI